MAVYKRPGVYVNELSSYSAPIADVGSANAAGAVVAAFPQGPSTVTKVSSYYEFKKLFGDLNPAYPSTYSVNQYFNNGGADLYVRRILNTTNTSGLSNAAAARAGVNNLKTSASNMFYWVAKNLGKDGNQLKVKLEKSSTIGWNATYKPDGANAAANTGAYDISIYRNYNGVDTLLEQFFGVFFSTQVAGEDIKLSPDYAPTVLNYGSNFVSIANLDFNIQLNTVSSAATDVYEPVLATSTLSGAIGNTPYAYSDWIGGSLATGTVALTSIAWVSATSATATYSNATQLAVVGQTLTLSGVTGTNNTYNQTVVVTAIGGSSTPFTFTFTPTTTAFVNVAGASGVVTGLTNTWDFGTAGTYSSTKNTIISEFLTVNQPLVFWFPDLITRAGANSVWDSNVANVYNKYIDFSANGTGLQQGVTIKHFVIVETGYTTANSGGNSSNAVTLALGAADDITANAQAAVYFPSIYIRDAAGNSGSSIRLMGPSGAVAGLYLNTDRTVGPWKSPAGITAKIVDAAALEHSFTNDELDLLNIGNLTSNAYYPVNAIRNLPGAGVVVMGARTLKQDGTANRYVAMRRSLTYIEKNLNDLSLFALFESNDEVLWSRLKTVLGNFLNNYRNQGGLRGEKADDAFFIKIDTDNNTPATIAAGEVHIEVGVALEYPAEFIVINLSQKTAI
jgi:hypothetical protein